MLRLSRDCLCSFLPKKLIVTRGGCLMFKSVQQTRKCCKESISTYTIPNGACIRVVNPTVKKRQRYRNGHAPMIDATRDCRSSQVKTQEYYTLLGRCLAYISVQYRNDDDPLDGRLQPCEDSSSSNTTSCCCCLHIKSRSGLYSVLSNIRTGPTDADAFRGHRLTT